MSSVGSSLFSGGYLIPVYIMGTRSKYLVNCLTDYMREHAILTINTDHRLHKLTRQCGSNSAKHPQFTVWAPEGASPTSYSLPDL